MTELLKFSQPAGLVDLATYVSRARRISAQGGARLVGVGSALAVYVRADLGSGVAMGLRIWSLAQPQTVDRTLSLAALSDRLARSPAQADELILPPMDAPISETAWAAILPPQHGWAADDTPISPAEQDCLAALGFDPQDAQLRQYSCGPWRRLSTVGGHLLLRPDPFRLGR
jgi:hypothetical protein